MRIPLVVGNWKMHGTPALIERAVDAYGGSPRPGAAEIVICPPFVFLAELAARLSALGVKVGAQNLSEHDEGAYTGEVAGRMLSAVGCRYVLVGHSERRALMGETDRQVADKFAAAQRADLTPILCVGESHPERQAGATFAVIGRQLQAVVERVGVGAFADAAIAYEPVWAIGSGLAASPAQAQEVMQWIRARLGAHGAQTRILYGGSVKAANVGELLAQADIDGVLVGGASLDADEFAKIGKLADRT